MVESTLEFIEEYIRMSLKEGGKRSLLAVAANKTSSVEVKVAQGILKSMGMEEEAVKLECAVNAINEVLYGCGGVSRSEGTWFKEVVSESCKVSEETARCLGASRDYREALEAAADAIAAARGVIEFLKDAYGGYLEGNLSFDLRCELNRAWKLAELEAEACKILGVKPDASPEDFMEEYVATGKSIVSRYVKCSEEKRAAGGSWCEFFEPADALGSLYKVLASKGLDDAYSKITDAVESAINRVDAEMRYNTDFWFNKVSRAAEILVKAVARRDLGESPHELLREVAKVASFSAANKIVEVVKESTDEVLDKFEEKLKSVEE